MVAKIVKNNLLIRNIIGAIGLALVTILASIIVFALLSRNTGSVNEAIDTVMSGKAINALIVIVILSVVNFIGLGSVDLSNAETDKIANKTTSIAKKDVEIKSEPMKQANVSVRDVTDVKQEEKPKPIIEPRVKSRDSEIEKILSEVYEQRKKERQQRL